MTEPKSMFDEEPTTSELKRETLQAVHANTLLHSVFLTDDRAKALLVLWEQACDRRVPVNASIQEYAAAEAVRSFVQTVKNQIALAKQLL